MFNELDCVKLIRRINNIPIDSGGVVLIVYEGGRHCEVEFFNEKLESLGTETVDVNDIVLEDRHIKS